MKIKNQEEKHHNNFNKLGLYISVISIFAIVCGTFFLFSNGLKMTVSSAETTVVTNYFNGWSFIFGGKIVSEHVSYDLNQASTLGISSIVIAFISLVLLIGSICFKKLTLKYIFAFCSFVGLLASSIIFFTFHREAANILATVMVKNPTEAIKNTIFENTQLGSAFIGIGLSFIFASLCSIVSLIFNGAFEYFKQRLIIKK